MDMISVDWSTVITGLFLVGYGAMILMLFVVVGLRLKWNDPWWARDMEFDSEGSVKVLTDSDEWPSPCHRSIRMEHSGNGRYTLEGENFAAEVFKNADEKVVFLFESFEDLVDSLVDKHKRHRPRKFDCWLCEKSVEQYKNPSRSRVYERRYSFGSIDLGESPREAKQLCEDCSYKIFREIVLSSTDIGQPEPEELVAEHI